ncbi:MAG: hypothetical protein VKL59_15740 [Nostocaceae cyanobacterium]|nr:hypothetical protein [Nostocaceae cyanobacterium]
MGGIDCDRILASGFAVNPPWGCIRLDFTRPDGAIAQKRVQ